MPWEQCVLGFGGTAQGQCLEIPEYTPLRAFPCINKLYFFLPWMRAFCQEFKDTFFMGALQGVRMSFASTSAYSWKYWTNHNKGLKKQKFLTNIYLVGFRENVWRGDLVSFIPSFLCAPCVEWSACNVCPRPYFMQFPHFFFGGWIYLYACFWGRDEWLDEVYDFGF